MLRSKLCSHSQSALLNLGDRLGSHDHLRRQGRQSEHEWLLQLFQRLNQRLKQVHSQDREEDRSVTDVDDGFRPVLGVGEHLVEVANDGVGVVQFKRAGLTCCESLAGRPDLGGELGPVMYFKESRTQYSARTRTAEIDLSFEIPTHPIEIIFFLSFPPSDNAISAISKVSFPPVSNSLVKESTNPSIPGIKSVETAERWAGIK